jgi:phenol hydroxylase P3 protein
MPKAKLSMRERYRLLTRDLDWTPTYVTKEDVYPYTRYEGIKIHDGTRGRTRSA